MITHKYVISLDGSSRRENFFAQEAAKDFEVFPAFDSRQGQGESLYDIERFLEYHPRRPTGPEMGCAISHYRAIKKFSELPGEDTDYLLAAEDDARFVEEFEDVLYKIVSCRKTYDYVILSDAFGRAGYKGIINFPAYSSHLTLRSKIFFKNGRIFRLGQFLANPWGTGLYLISKKAAKDFVLFVESFQDGIWWLSDDYELFIDKINIDFYHLKPALADYETLDESVNGLVLSDYLKRKSHFLEYSLTNSLKFFKLKLIMVFKSTIKFSKF